LNPQWIVDAFRCLIKAPKFEDFKCNNLDTLWNMYKLNAELTRPLVDGLWKDEQFAAHKTTLLVLMEKMGLVARPIRLNTRGKEQLEYYIVPTLLKVSECDWLVRILAKDNTVQSRTLCFVYNFIPFTIFHKLMAMCIANFKIATKQLGKTCLQKEFGCFMVDSFWFMALSCKNSVIKVTMFKFDDKNVPVQAEAFVQTRLFLEESLQQIFQLHHLKNVKTQYCIHCNFQYKEDQTLNSVPDLLSSERLACCQPSNTHFVNKSCLDPWFTRKETEDLQKNY